MKYQLYTNASKKYRWLLVVISEWFSWNELIFLRSELMLQLSEFLWTPRSSVGVFFINFILIDATNRSKTRSDQKHLFFAVNLNPLSFFANTPFNTSKDHKFVDAIQGKFRSVDAMNAKYAIKWKDYNKWTGLS